MGKLITRYFQTCEFCHKQVETDGKGLRDINLPGYNIGDHGEKSKTIVSGTICNECMEKLRDSLAEFIRLEEVEYVGNDFSWIKK